MELITHRKSLRVISMKTQDKGENDKRLSTDL